MIPLLLTAGLGFVTGWIINYLADVMPIKRRLCMPICLHCHSPITWQDYILFRPCAACGHKAGMRKLLVLLFCIAAGVYLWRVPPMRLGFWLAIFLGGYLLLVAIIDLEYRLVLHPISLVGVVICLGIGSLIHGILPTILGGVGGFAIMLALYYLGDLFARWIARRRGEELDEVALGFGDVILSGVLGLVLGWPGIVGGLVVAILLGGVISIGIIVIRLVRRTYQPFTAIPYAPFLILGTILFLFRA